MKVVQINATCGIGSTGKICVDISKVLTEKNIENYILYSSKSNGYELGIRCATKWYTKLQALKSHVCGNYGFNSHLETKRIIEHLERIQPDIVHIHNIHGHDCNLETLFKYFKRNKTKLIWTFHDSWGFTSYCTYFDRIGCSKWKTGCKNCAQAKNYSFFLDKSKSLYRRKKKLFSNLDLTIVTPSAWLAELVKKSFLKKYPIIVINNGIDLDVFNTKNIKECKKMALAEDKKIILGVAFDWGLRKGLDVFVELATLLDDEKYQIVLVGTNDEVDKQLPRNIVSIHKTQNQNELAELYSMASIFVNPTREDNYPTVNMEAIACGTPVITFNTGGSPEIVNEHTGIVVVEKTCKAICEAIGKMSSGDWFSEEKCVLHAKQFDKRNKYLEYYNLYKDLLGTQGNNSGETRNCK